MIIKKLTSLKTSSVFVVLVVMSLLVLPCSLTFARALSSASDDCADDVLESCVTFVWELMTSKGRGDEGSLGPFEGSGDFDFVSFADIPLTWLKAKRRNPTFPQWYRDQTSYLVIITFFKPLFAISQTLRVSFYSLSFLKCRKKHW